MAGVAAEMLETGVPNLDRILGGGILPRSVAMVIGAPGTGKTVLAQQIAFHFASRGAPALYLTGYSETHDKLVAHNLGLGFFAPALIGQELQFGSLPDLLRRGADETEDAIVATARKQRSSLVVLDGFRSMRGFLANDQAAAHFLYSLGAKLALRGATTLVLVEGDPGESSRYPELTVCDVILALRRLRHESRQRRTLEVLKSRGARPLGGDHPFEIDDTGIAIFPRFESVVTATAPAWNQERAAFGVASLDALIGGGLNAGTVTLVAGSPGVGKTTLGLHFTAEGARIQEPVLYLGFMESEAQLREKARVYGMDLGAAEAAGQVRFMMLPGHDLEADQIAAALVEDIERRGVRRLVIDSVAELQRGVVFQGRVPDFLSALVSYLRGRNVTSYLTLDLPVIMGPQLELAGTPLSVLAENLLLFRQVEYRGRLHRVFSVFKMRFSGYEPEIYELAITPGRGIEIVGRAPLGEGLLTGAPRLSGESPAESDLGVVRGQRGHDPDR
jgi:circadian clock protein KaiC